MSTFVNTDQIDRFDPHSEIDVADSAKTTLRLAIGDGLSGDLDTDPEDDGPLIVNSFSPDGDMIDRFELTITARRLGPEE